MKRTTFKWHRMLAGLLIWPILLPLGVLGDLIRSSLEILVTALMGLAIIVAVIAWLT